MDLLNISAMKAYLLTKYIAISLNIFATKTYLLIKYIIISLSIAAKNIYYFINANLKTKYLLVLKAFCFVILYYEGFEITADFLHYPYVYTFGVETFQG